MTVLNAATLHLKSWAHAGQSSNTKEECLAGIFSRHEWLRCFQAIDPLAYTFAYAPVGSSDASVSTALSRGLMHAQQQQAS